MTLRREARSLSGCAGRRSWGWRAWWLISTARRDAPAQTLTRRWTPTGTQRMAHGQCTATRSSEGFQFIDFWVGGGGWLTGVVCIEFGFQRSRGHFGCTKRESNHDEFKYRMPATADPGFDWSVGLERTGAGSDEGKVVGAPRLLREKHQLRGGGQLGTHHLWFALKRQWGNKGVDDNACAPRR